MSSILTTCDLTNRIFAVYPNLNHCLIGYTSTVEYYEAHKEELIAAGHPVYRNITICGIEYEQVKAINMYQRLSTENCFKRSDNAYMNPNEHQVVTQPYMYVVYKIKDTPDPTDEEVMATLKLFCHADEKMTTNKITIKDYLVYFKNIIMGDLKAVKMMVKDATVMIGERMRNL